MLADFGIATCAALGTPGSTPRERRTAGTVSAAAAGEDPTDLDQEFAVFVRTRQQSLLGLAYLLTRSHHDAQDLVQTALVKTYLKWAKLHRGHNADAYVRKIIINENAGNWRRAWRRRERSTDDLGEVADATAPQGTADDAIWPRVLELPERQRAAIALRFYEDLSVAETAEILGCSTGTVKSQTSRALATLRQSVDVQELGASRQ